ncbi:MAG: DUF4340 domain-containing protein [Coprococcus sp.]|nr:DUF4340 domain-containing protein [Coprococcus sp.]
MNRSKRLYVLLGVLLVFCVLTLGVSKYEERKEKIKNSDEIVLEINSEDVTSISWECGAEVFAFHKDGTWLYDEDEDFPVDEEKVGRLLEIFESFGVSFIIEDAENLGQYGLDTPLCKIDIGVGEETYKILVGDYSAMDEERYVSIGDGNVYLVSDDPLGTFDIGLSDMIRHDEVPEFDSVTEIEFAGSENYKVVYKEDNKVTYSKDDIYFAKEDGNELPLDPENVESYLDIIRGLNLTEYVSYDASEEELKAYGLDAPELTVTLQYHAEDEESGEEKEGTAVLHISRDPEEKKEAKSETGDEIDTESEEELTAYARIGESQIIYKISRMDYENLMKASCNDLRHHEVVWADQTEIRRIEISLEGMEYELTVKEEDGEDVWYYQEEEIEAKDFFGALGSLTSAEFTEERQAGKEEISLTLYIDNENQPEVQIELYRYDGNRCLAVVDGDAVSLVRRSDVVSLTEAVNAIVLN